MIENASIYFGSLVAFALAIRLYTKDFDDDLSPDARESLSIRLLCLKEPTGTSFFDWVSTIFDTLFGKKHLSFRCFFMSSIVSIVSFTAIFFLLGTTDPDFNVTAEIFAKVPLLILIAGMIVNVPSDYLALLETRWIIKSSLPTFWKITIDLLLTYIVGLGWLALLVALIVDPQISLITFWVVLIDPVALGSVIDYSNPEHDGAAFLALTLIDVFVFYIFFTRVVLATSYVTSVWVWAYGLSDLFIRFLSGNRRLMEYLNVETKPTRAIGLVASISVMLIGTLAYLVMIAVRF